MLKTKKGSVDAIFTDVAIMKYMNWSYRDLDEAPHELINAVTARMVAENKISDEEQKRQRRRNALQ